MKSGYAEAVCWLAVVIYAVTQLCYWAKIAARPAVLMEDLSVLPARGAVSAGSMCMMLAAGIIWPYAPDFARWVLLFALFVHGVYALCVLRILLDKKDFLSTVNPAILLPFVGQIVFATVGIKMGFVQTSHWILILTAPIGIAIMVLSVRNMMKNGVPAPFRINYLIPLGPISIYALAAADIWPEIWFWIFAGMGWAWLLATSKYWRVMIDGGWTPAWAAMTFPVVTFAASQIVGIRMGMLGGPEVPLTLSALATALTVYVVFMAYLRWAQGKLATASKAAIA